MINWSQQEMELKFKGTNGRKLMVVLFCFYWFIHVWVMRKYQECELKFWLALLIPVKDRTHCIRGRKCQLAAEWSRFWCFNFTPLHTTPWQSVCNLWLCTPGHRVLATRSNLLDAMPQVIFAQMNLNRYKFCYFNFTNGHFLRSISSKEQ